VTGLSPEKSRKNSHMLRNLETPQKQAIFEDAIPNVLELIG